MGARSAAKEGERKGDFLGGKYLLEDCLGIGGMGEVYRATNVSLGRKVAIKLLNKEHTGNEDDVMRFLREARAAAAVRHPNVVDVFDVARDDDGTPFIVQELLSGQDLEQYLGASGGVLSASEALEILIPVADAVSAAHKQNVVHRDLKPANIFLAREGQNIIPKVLDFGACLYQTVGALSAKEQRMLIGTPHYMAPEQIATAVEVDARADVWAMGVILYELLVGETPFEAQDATAVMKLVRTRAVPRLRTVAPRSSASLEELVARCLDRDRRKRYADAAAVRVELGKIRKELRPERRKPIDTDSEQQNELALLASKKAPPIRESREPREARDPRQDADDPPSQRAPSIVLKGGRPPTKRRGSSLLTLSSPDDPVAWDSDPPTSASRPIESAKPVRASAPDARAEVPDVRVAEAARPRRTAADVLRDADLAAATGRGAISSRPPPAPRPPSVRPPPAPALPFEFGDEAIATATDPMLDLDLEMPSPPRGEARISSMPPVLDPRAAAPGARVRSDRPPPPAPLPNLTAPEGRESRDSRDARESIRDAPVSPPAATGARPNTPVSVRPPAAIAPPMTPSSSGAWPVSSRLALAATVIVPAAIAFVALRFAPVVLEPLGHAMRGDSPLASGVLAVLTLVVAAALAARSLGSSRGAGMLVATAGAILLGIMMIIVTFSSSETTDLDIPPAAAGIVPFVAPIVPLGLGLAAFARARAVWRSRYERGEAITFGILTALMLLAVLELGPLGAVRAATRSSGPAVTSPSPARPSP